MCACAVTRCPLCVPAAGRDGEMEIVTVSDPSLLAPSDVSAIALDFKVLHPVVITQLGVFPSGTRAELQSNVTVKLLQLDQEVTRLWPVSIMHGVCCVSVELGRNTARGQLEDSVLLLFVEQTSAHFSPAVDRAVCGCVQYGGRHLCELFMDKKFEYFFFCTFLFRRLWLLLASAPLARGPW